MAARSISRSNDNPEEMKHDILIQPETEEEVELLNILTDAREYAIEETNLTEAEIAAVYSQFSSGLSSEHDDDIQRSDLYCPECEEPVEDVEAGGMGADPVCQPCGHEVEWSDLPADLYG